MGKRTLMACAAVVAVAVATSVLAWLLWRNPAPLHTFGFGAASPAARTLSSRAIAPGAANEAVHKCRRGANVEYTNGECPSGSVEEPLSAGSLTVLPSAMSSATSSLMPASPAASARPLLRDVGSAVDAAAFREKRLDQALGK